MKASPMIRLDLKSTDELDWATPLRRYISRIYGSSNEFTDDTLLLNKLRQDARSALKDRTGAETLLRYFHVLEQLDLRVPIEPHGVSVSFTWRDARTNAPATQHSLAFEKAAVLFNLAAVYSHVGADSDDPKAACQAFQTAAGVLRFLAENFLHAPTADLRPDTATALSRIMVAQAQEAFLARQAGAAGAKKALSAKLAKGCATLYATARDALKESSVAEWAPPTWISYCGVKSDFFRAEALHFHAQAIAETRPGDAVAYAQLAASAAAECRTRHVPAEFTEFTATIKDAAESIATSATALGKDNDFVYHATVPSTASLPELAGIEAVKPADFRTTAATIEPPAVFTRLVPLEVHEKASVYSEKAAEMLRAEAAKLENADESLVSVLARLKLPDAVTEIRSALHNDTVTSQIQQLPQIPNQIRAWATEIAAEPDVSLSQLANRRARCLAQLKAAKAELEAEESTSDPATNSIQTEELRAALRTDLTKATRNLADAADADEQLERLLASHKQTLAVLAGGPESRELTQMFTPNTVTHAAPPPPNLLDLEPVGGAGSTGSATGTAEANLRAVEEKLLRLNQLKKERDLTYSELKAAVHADDVSDVLLRVKNGADEVAVFREALAKFDPYLGRLATAVDRQEAELTELEALWRIVEQDSAVKVAQQREASVAQQKTEAEERLRRAYEAWRKARAGVRSGLEFYDNLAAFVDTVKGNVASFVASRKAQKSSGVAGGAAELNGAFRGLSLSGSSDMYAGLGNRQPQNTGFATYTPSQPPLPPKPQPQPQFQPPQPQMQPPQQYTGSYGGAQAHYATPSAYSPDMYNPGSSAPAPPSHPTYAQPYDPYRK